MRPWWWELGDADWTIGWSRSEEIGDDLASDLVQVTAG
jgi:hypothetical protein